MLLIAPAPPPAREAGKGAEDEEHAMSLDLCFAFPQAATGAWCFGADARLSYGRSRPIDEVGQVVLQRSGLESEGTSCVNTPCARSASNAASSSRRQSAITSSHITATSTNSGSSFPVALQVMSR